MRPEQRQEVMRPIDLLPFATGLTPTGRRSSQNLRPGRYRPGRWRPDVIAESLNFGDLMYGWDFGSMGSFVQAGQVGWE